MGGFAEARAMLPSGGGIAGMNLATEEYLWPDAVPSPPLRPLLAALALSPATLQIA
jgi:hypothetical protein